MSFIDRVMRVGRAVKHQLFLAWKFKHLHLRHLEPVRDAYQRRFPVPLDDQLRKRSFLANDAPDQSNTTEPLPRVIWVVWTGTNPMSPARRRSLDEIRRIQTGFDVRLVTPETLHEQLVPGHPLHPQYENLTLVHRSDYLRAYLLRHHGGGYVDVKRPLHHWGEVVRDFERGGYWFAGYPEIVYLLIPRPAPFGEALRRMSVLMTGQGAFLARAGSPFVVEWLHEVEATLDRCAQELEAHPGDTYGLAPGYPLRWTQLLAEITEPLEYKYSHRVLRDRRLLIRTRNYR